MFASLWRQTSQAVLDTVFPLSCLGCRSEGSWLCQECRDRVPLLFEQRCPACRKPSFPYGETCRPCRNQTALDGLFAATYYRLPVIRRAIHIWKYRFMPGLAEPLGAILTEALMRSPLPLPEALVPVPLHPRRLRFRGFNQSELLSRRVAAGLAPGISLPILAAELIRVRYTKPQMRASSREERLANLRRAFTVRTEVRERIRGQSIWLIDDIATTSATLEECAKALKEAGAKSVFGIVLAT